MSYIPNCREDNSYNEKYLNDKDKEFLGGYDWATEMAVDNFFDNNYLKYFSDDSYLSHILTQPVPKYLREQYLMEFAFGDKKPEHRTVETYADLLRMQILECLEVTRNELITSMLDAMGLDEYEAMKESVNGSKEEGRSSSVD